MGPATRLVLARHGQAQCNVDGRVGGPITCTGLTDVGRAQVGKLAARLTAEQRDGPVFDALYTGPRRRLIETSRILAAGLGLTAVIDSGLDGPRHGDADGRLWQDVETAFRGAPHTHPDQPYAPGAETWNEYLHRAAEHLKALLDRHQGQTVLLAVHGETIQAACHLLLGLDSPSEATPSKVSFGTDHASLTRFVLGLDEFGNRGTTLMVLNDTTHLSRP